MPNDAPAADPRFAWQEATIETIVPHTQRVKSFLLRPRTWHPFTAGQHVDVRLTAPDGYQAERSYSVASAPETRGLYELAIERLHDGEVSPFFHEVAEAGDTIEVRGPFGGHFVWNVVDGGPVLLIGGGSGVAPLMAMIRHRAKTGGNAKAFLLYASRTWDELIFREELLARDAAEPGFTLAISVSREPDPRPGAVNRRIDAALLRNVLGKLGETPRVTFVCGSNRFVEGVTGHLLDLGMDQATIRTERFGGA